MKAIRIHDRAVLETPLLQELFVRAFKEFDGEDQIDPEEAWKWCISEIHRPEMAVVVVRNEDCELVGLSIGDWVPSVWSPDPWGLYMYSNGEKAALDALLAEMRVWGLGLGQERVRVINMTGISDKGYTRLMRKHADAHKLGSVFIGKWEED